jgi:DNA-binding transcriptional LysR family regulator
MFAREAAPALHDTIVTTFRQVGVVLRPRHRATDLASALTLVAAGLGVTVVPSGWHPPRSFGLTCRPLRPPATSLAFGVAYRRDASTPLITRFVAAARAVTAVVTATSRARTG